MEKLIEHIKSIRGNSLTEYGENKLLAEQSRSLAIEFADWLHKNAYRKPDSNSLWYLDEGMSGDLHKTETLFDLFLSQKQF